MSRVTAETPTSFPDQAADTTSVLAGFVAELTFESLPLEVVARIGRQAVDIVGVALAASHEPAFEIAAAMVCGTEPGDAATIWGTPARASVTGAAFANGIAAHVADAIPEHAREPLRRALEDLASVTDVSKLAGFLRTAG